MFHYQSCIIQLSGRPFNDIKVVVLITNIYIYIFMSCGNNTRRSLITGDRPVFCKREEVTFLEGSSTEKIKSDMPRCAVTFQRGSTLNV